MPFSVIRLLPQVSLVWGAVTMPSSVLGLLPQVSSVWRGLLQCLSQFLGLLPQLSSVGEAVTMPQISSVWGSCYHALLKLLGLLPHVSFVGRAVTTPSSVIEAVTSNFSVGGAVTTCSEYVFIFRIPTGVPVVLFPVHTLSLVKLLISRL